MRTLLALLLLASPAIAHDALPTNAQPLGWTYPWSCCSGMDCRQISKDKLTESAQGYVYRPTGELIPMTSDKIKDSPDGEFHVCTKDGKEDGKVICLFVPPRGF